MIKAIIFDLDGTLVQTEALKAISYAQAAMKLSEHRLDQEAVIEAFKEVVGLSRQEVAQTLMRKFALEQAADAFMAEFGVATSWQAFVQVRLQIYEVLLSDPKILHDYLCPYNVALLNYARKDGFLTGLATKSFCTQVRKVLELLHLRDKFDFMASRDDVENGKPDPEIYVLVARELDVSPPETLVIEDSPAGTEAALAAGMGCIVVTTDFTRKAIHASGLLEQRWIVDSPPDLNAVARQFIAESNGPDSR